MVTDNGGNIFTTTKSYIAHGGGNSFAWSNVEYIASPQRVPAPIAGVSRRYTSERGMPNISQPIYVRFKWRRLNWTGIRTKYSDCSFTYKIHKPVHILFSITEPTSNIKRFSGNKYLALMVTYPIVLHTTTYWI